MTVGRKYYGQAYADKCYRGPKNVNVQLSAAGATKLAENLRKAIDAGRQVIDLAVYASDNGQMISGERARITITSLK